MKIFVSYSHEDHAIVEALTAQLRAVGVQVWADRDVSPGENLALAIGKALEQSDAMIVLVSPKSMKSLWVQRELEYALTSPNFKGRLIVVEIKPTKQIPWILRKFRPIRFYESPAKAKRSIVNRVRNLAKATANAS
jgi:hypothetical protein